MKSLYFIILFISFSLFSCSINKFFLEKTVGIPLIKYNSYGKPQMASSIIEVSNSSKLQYECLVNTDNHQFEPLIQYYKNNCKNNENDCPAFTLELNKLAKQCKSLKKQCKCEKFKTQKQAEGCLMVPPKVICSN